MATEKTIGGSTYNIPNQGENPAWGEEQHDALVALFDEVNGIVGPNDIAETSATIVNVGGVENIVGLKFAIATVRSAEISYNISRKITKSISSTSDVGGTEILVTCAQAHNLFTDDSVTIAATEGQAISGTYTITKMSDTTFKITAVWSSPTTAATFQIELLEAGTILAQYGLQGLKMIEEADDDALVLIDIAADGQFTYNPTVLLGAAYTGLMKFVAKAIITT